MFGPRSWAHRAGVTLALLVSLTSGTATLPHTDGPDDFECNPIPVAHDESAHYIGPATVFTAPDAGHCFLCHSVRSFYSAFDRFEQHDNAPHAERLHAAQIDRPALVEWTLVPGRAPPV
jgi:hypothetical protein